MTQTEFNKIIEECKSIREKKNHDYGNGFLEWYSSQEKIENTLGNITIFFDINRKYKRLETLLLKNKKNLIKDETLEDTLMDLSITCINALIALRQKR